MIIPIPIPEDSICLLKPNQKVDFEIPFIKKKQEKEITVLVSRKLKIPPKKIFRYLKKFIGDKLKKDDLIAIKKGFFSTKKVISPADGVIKEINHEKGEIIIEVEEGDINTIKTYFTGEVNEIKKNNLFLKTKKGEEFPLKFSSADFGGEVIYLEDDQTERLTTEIVNKKIIVCNSLSSYLQLKSEVLGVKGFVTILKLSQQTQLPFCRLKIVSDLKKIFSQKLPYCLINKNSSKIYFYSV